MTDKTFAVITARAGSNRLPRKNKRLLGGKPLFMWSLEAALQAGVFDQVWVSSDDEEILELSASVSGVYVDKRPPHLCNATAKGMEVLAYMIERVRNLDRQFQRFFLLHPTSPFRGVSHLREAFSLLDDPLVDFVVGVSPFQTSPDFALSLENGVNPVKEGYLTRITQTQDLTVYHHPAGGLYAGKIESFLETHHFYGPRCRPLVLDFVSGWDINTLGDFSIAEAFYHHYFLTKEK